MRRAETIAIVGIVIVLIAVAIIARPWQRPGPSTPQRASMPTPAAVSVAPWATIRLEKVAGDFQQLTYLTHAGDGSGRMFVVEKPGRVWILQDGKRLPQPFLDITDRVRSRESERGLLSIAFHPSYEDNGRFFVNYTDQKGNTVVAEYRVSSDPNRADPNSERVLLYIEQPAANHNGGQLQFGPDGYLYIGMGDGGSAGDPWGNAQNLGVLLGKMLRIDVDGGDPYGVPSDNPFVGQEGARPEIWAYGLRNPWRFSFDRQTGDLYIADVGQNKWEEVDVALAPDPGGQNYGWDIMEGFHCFEPPEGCDPTGLTPPVVEYGHDKGCSITGGYVYRGPTYTDIQGTYFFSDFCTGTIWGLRRRADGWEWAEFLSTGLNVSTFGEDEIGEMYVLDYAGGGIYHLVGSERQTTPPQTTTAEYLPLIEKALARAWARKAAGLEEGCGRANGPP